MPETAIRGGLHKMAKWQLVQKSGGGRSSYSGWFRNHPLIHMGKETPMKKTSLVQIHCDSGGCEMLAQTTAHSVFSPPGTKGTTLFKRVTHYKTKPAATRAATKMKVFLAKKWDKVTGKV